MARLYPFYSTHHKLGEEETEERDEASRKVLPPRNVSKVSRTLVPRESPSPDVLDQASVATGCKLRANQDTMSHQGTMLYRHAPTKASHRTKPIFSKLPPVSIVGDHAFAHLYNQPGVELFTMSFSDINPRSV